MQRCAGFLAALAVLAACGGSAGTVRNETANGSAGTAGFLVQQGHGAAVTVAAIAADGSRAATLDETGTLCLWDGAGRLTARLTGPGGEGRLLEISPAGDVVAAVWYDVLAFSQNAAVYRFSDGALVWRKNVPDAIGALAWNGNGTELALAAGRTALVLDRDGETLRRATPAGIGESGIVAVALSDDGRLAAVDASGALCLVAPDGAVTRSGALDKTTVTALAFETNGTLLAGYRHGFRRQVFSDGRVGTDRFCGGPVAGFCRAQNKTVATVIVNGTIAGIADSAGVVRVQRYLPRAARFPAAIRIAADGSCLGGHADGGVSFFRRDGTLVPVAPEAPAITALAVSPQGLLTIGTADGRIVFFDAALRIRSSMNAHAGRVCALVWRPDGQMLMSCGYDGRVSLWNAAGIGISTRVAHREAANAGAWSRDGAYFATVGTWDKSIRLFHADGRAISTMSGHFEAIMGVSFAPDGGSLVSAANDSTIRLWSLADGKERTLARMSGIASLAHDASGRRLLVAGHEGARIIAAATGDVLENIGSQISVGAAWNGDRVFVAIADGGVQEWPAGHAWFAGGAAAAIATGGAALPVVVGLADGRIVVAGKVPGSRLTLQLFADGRSLVYDESGRWDAGDGIAAGRFARLAAGAVRMPGLAASFAGP